MAHNQIVIAIMLSADDIIEQLRKDSAQIVKEYMAIIPKNVLNLTVLEALQGDARAGEGTLNNTDTDQDDAKARRKRHSTLSGHHKDTVPIPSTPHLCSDLPETPLIVRKRALKQLSKEKENTAPLKIERPSSKKDLEQQKRQESYLVTPGTLGSRRTKQPLDAVTRIKINRGKVLDLTKSPKSALADLGIEAIRALRTRLDSMFQFFHE